MDSFLFNLPSDIVLIFKSGAAYENSPFLIELQEAVYDEKAHILTVPGFCTVRQGHIQLECSRLVYDQFKNNIFVWKGQLKDTSGDRIYFDKGVLNHTLTTGNFTQCTYVNLSQRAHDC